MKKYDSGDMATFYFVVKENHQEKEIKGWTDIKQLAEFYMDFHKCPSYRLKKITKTIEDIVRITEENRNDEIEIVNIYVKDRDNIGDVKIIVIPATETERQFIREETETCFASRIAYGYLNGAIPYLKNKYKEALNDIFLLSIINKTVHNRNDKHNRRIDFDQLMVLFRAFPNDFGE